MLTLLAWFCGTVIAIAFTAGLPGMDGMMHFAIGFGLPFMATAYGAYLDTQW